MQTFWEKWGGLTQRLVASVGSQASLVALVLAFAPQPITLEGYTAWLVLIATALAVASVVLEVRSELAGHKHIKTYRSNDSVAIKGYMRHWIKTSGRAAIWTRDLSWVDDDETKSVLEAKAKTGNLTICMPKMNDIGQYLQKAGAEVCIYGAEGFESPESRFTISYVGNGGTQVAIGRTDAGNHVINEINSNHPAMYMAKDLVALAKLLAAGKTRDA